MPTGKWVMRYSMGMSIFYLPFFLIGHLLALIFNFPADGFSEPYQYSIWAGCMFYTFTGIFILRKSLLKFFEDKIVSLILIIIVLGTNYTLHTSIHGQGAMSHNILFTVYTLILWFTIRWHETLKFKYAFLLSIFCGLAALARPTEIVCILIPIFWNVYSKQSLYEKISLLQKNKKQVIGFAIMLISIGFIQFTYWKIYAGQFIFDSYNNPGEGLDFPPHTINTLFSFRNGWFIYTPVMIFAVIGFFSLFKQNPMIFWGIFIYFIVNLLVVSSWTLWWYAQCFGQRALIPSYAILSIPLGYFLKTVWMKDNKLRYFIFIIITFFVLLNLFQTWQVANGILISYRATPKFWWAVFGKTYITPEDKKLLYMEWPTSGIEIYPNDTNHIQTHTWRLEFEETEGYPKDKLSKEIFHSGNSSFILDSITEFSPAIEKKYTEITNKYYAWIRVSVWVYPTFDIKQKPVSVVCTFTHKGKAYKYKSVDLNKFPIELNKWNFVTFDYLTPEVLRNKNDHLAVYVWNLGKNRIFIDELKVEVFEPKSEP